MTCRKNVCFFFYKGRMDLSFSQLAGALESYGHTTCQIGFNQGD